MMTNQTLTAAITATRIARKLGKISAEVQRLTLLQLNHPVLVAQVEREKVAADNWQHLMAMRNIIEQENLPLLQAKREAEEQAFQIRCLHFATHIQGFIPESAVDHELTPEWWVEAGKRDRARAKAARAAGKVDPVDAEDEGDE